MASAPTHQHHRGTIDVTKDIDASVRAIISSLLEVPLESVQPTSVFHDELCLDGFDWIEMLVALEDEFDIEISDETSEAFKTVADVIAHVAERLGLVEVAA